MEPPRHSGRFLGRLVEALKGIAGRLRRQKPPAMIGLPPSARGLKAIPDDIEEHAKDFATRYWEPLEAIARKRMREVGVPEDRIGMLDADNDFRLAAFHPHRTTAEAYILQTGRINLDAGIFKPDLLAERAAAGGIVASCEEPSFRPAGRDHRPRIRGRRAGGVTLPPRNMHPDTQLTIKAEARQLLRARRKSERLAMLHRLTIGHLDPAAVRASPDGSPPRPWRWMSFTDCSTRSARRTPRAM